MTPPRARYDVAPAEGPVEGEVLLPGSKSLTNRALCLAALAEGESRLESPLLSDDTLFMVAGLKNIGIQVRKREMQDFITVLGKGGRIPWGEGRVWAGSAGTVMRFMTALLTLGNGTYRLDGDDHLRRRPLSTLVEALRSVGASIRCLGHEGTRPPLEITGNGTLRGGRVLLPGETSSQFLTALLLAGPRMEEGIDVVLEGELTSKPYADLTVDVMGRFGVIVEREGYERFRVGPGTYRGTTYRVEGDASAATYFLAVPAVLGGRVRVRGVGRESSQGDAAFPSVLERMGAEVTSGPDWIEVAGPVKTGGVFDMNAMPDATLTLAVLGPFVSSPIEIRNVPNLRLKESDRIASLGNELARLGARVETFDDGLTVHPGPLKGARVETYNDHRVAMAFAVAGLAVPGVSIEDPGCVSKSFPDFFERLESLTGRKGTLVR
jgi:3-phosphoshikimate 1-carboxyvinyltransferase